MSVYGVAGQWMGSMSIDGRTVVVDTRQIFQEITVRSSIHMDLPSLTFVANDFGSELIDKIKVCDGMLCQVSMSDGSAPGPVREFIFKGGPVTQPGPSADIVTMRGVLNKPKWGKQIWSKAVKGTSDEVITQMAQAAGLKPLVDKARDAMVWLPKNISISEYARFLGQRAWFGEKSAPIQGIRPDGTYLFHDLEKLFNNSSSKGRAIGMRRGDIPYRQHSIVSKGSVANSARGYGSTSVFDPGTGKIEEFGKTMASFLNGGLGAIGKSWQDAVGALGARVEFAPIDSGNAHPRYHQARHQNARVRGTYSEDVHVMLDRESGYEILEKVEFHPFDRYGQPIEAYTGEYLVTNKVQSLREQKYIEKLTLTTNSTAGDKQG